MWFKRRHNYSIGQLLVSLWICKSKWFFLDHRGCGKLERQWLINFMCYNCKVMPKHVASTLYCGLYRVLRRNLEIEQRSSSVKCQSQISSNLKRNMCRANLIFQLSSGYSYVPQALGTKQKVTNHYTLVSQHLDYACSLENMEFR